MTRALNQFLAYVLSLLVGCAMGWGWFQVCKSVDAMMYVFGIK